MFQDRNKPLIQLNDNNEFFFDRNGQAFHYIMEFYRNGEILWDPNNLQRLVEKFPVTRQELELELDYFQIQVKGKKNVVKDIRVERALNLGSIHINMFVKALEDLVLEHLSKLGRSFKIFASSGSIFVGTDINEPGIDSSYFNSFATIGYRLLKEIGLEISVYLQSTFPELNITWETLSYGDYIVIRVTLGYDFKSIVAKSIVGKKN